ncbi:hypothetical protein JAAARDRAFT_487265 [Jaapia argillacea MUCL 33604]|uniref:Uncharacterized protein n=1 Tax=Jaapia argillacea MUCL 33604 TaxID=933084 RepID=A0A067PEK2_9AGAM|nr:hypothetical protein JAAARDRAFT_487265 [Jaapia argillacea MUCL 33604]
MIQGDHSVDDIWTLWQPGDEEWLRSNLQRDGDGWLLDGRAWEHARKAYRRRVDHLASRGVPDLWPTSVKEKIWNADTPTRALAIAWLINISPFVTEPWINLDLDLSIYIHTWIRASGNLLVFLGLPIQLLTGFVDTLPDSGHTCSFWDSSASSWAALFSWLYDYHDYHILVAHCDDKGFFPTDEDEWIPCDACRSVRERFLSGPLPWVLDPKIRQNRPPVWQILLLLASCTTSTYYKWSSLDEQDCRDVVDNIVLHFDNLDSSLVKNLPMIEYMAQNREIHQPDPQYDTFVNRFPAVWRPIISSSSCTLRVPNNAICNLGEPQGDLQTPIGAILWKWVDSWSERHGLCSGPVSTCDQILEWRRLLFTNILPALQISSSTPFNPTVQKSLDVLRKSQHTCHYVLTDDEWALWAASRFLLDKIEDIEEPVMNLHHSQDARYNQHICPNCDVDHIQYYSALRQSVDPDALIREGNLRTLSMLRMAVDLLCDMQWITQHEEDGVKQRQWLLDLLQRFLDCPRSSWVRDGADAADIIAQQKKSSYKSTIHCLVVKLSDASGLLPASIFLQEITQSSEGIIAGGGYADIFAGEWAGRNVAIKWLRLQTASREEWDGLKKV